MNEKFSAGLITASAIAPLCAVCLLGSAAVISFVAGVAGWLGGAGPVLTIGTAVAAGGIAWRTMRRRIGYRH